MLGFCGKPRPYIPLCSRSVKPLNLCQEVLTNYMEYDGYYILTLCLLGHLYLFICFIYCIFIALQTVYLLYIALSDGLYNLREALYQAWVYTHDRLIDSRVDLRFACWVGTKSTTILDSLGSTFVLWEFATARYFHLDRWLWETL